jgi:hydrogenase maturation protease
VLSVSDRPRILVLGYGNPGRLDDGIGPAIAEAVAAGAAEAGLARVTVESNFQLNIEDAAQAAEHDVVVFADASVSAEAPFEFTRVEPKLEGSFTTHSVRPSGVMALARDEFGSGAQGYVLAVPGEAFDDFGEELSATARHRVQAAASFLLRLLDEARDQSAFDAAAAGDHRPIASRTNGM